jgi:elongation of very long chain fatty acids protein 4
MARTAGGRVDNRWWSTVTDRLTVAVLCRWVIVYFAPGGEAYFSAALNSFVHVVMYGYYLWATYAPKVAEGKRPGPLHPTFYKRYITSMQMTQFAVMMIQAAYDLIFPSHYPRFCVWILFIYMWTMLALFGNFFIQSYIRGGNKGGKKDGKKEGKKAQ